MLRRSGVGKIRVVDAAVVGQSVTAQLAADGRDELAKLMRHEI